MANKYLLALTLSIGIVFSSGSQITLDSTVVDTTTVISGIDIPWEILWGPDEQIWMTERYGRVSRVDPTSGAQDVILDLSDSVHQQSESGLLGMALHPDFENDPRVFLVYTYLDGSSIKEKLVSYTYNDTVLVNPFTLIDNIPGNSTHDGSRLLILPDLTILMTTGDAQAQGTPQNLNSVNGKTLRLNLDGSIPADNPFSGNPAWSWGHRNAQGLLLAPNGHIYSSEHGPTTDDELNLLEAGRNYGWPDVHGLCDEPSEMTFCNDSNVFEPLLNWTPTIATSDIAWYDHPSIPEFRQSILMAVLKNKRLISMKLNASGTEITDEKHYFINTWGRLRDLCVSPDGSIYLATNGDDWSNSDPFTHSIVRVFNINHPVGIPDEAHDQFRIWPQPSNGTIHVRLTSAWTGGVLEVVDLTGRRIRTMPIDESLFNITTDNFPPGLYLVNIKKAGQLLTRKLLIR